MKKIFLLLALILICSSLSGVISLADDPATCTITYFTNDDYLLMDDPRDSLDRIYKSVEVEVEYGHVLTSRDIPHFDIYIMGCDAEVAWAGDENPLGFEATKDMTFEAYVANKPDELAEVRYFGIKLCPPGSYGDYYFSDLTISYPVGYTLTEQDIPFMYHYIVGYDELKWTPDPIGATVYGGEEFEAERTEALTVIFIDMHYYNSGNSRWAILAYYDLEYGASVEPPREDEIPQHQGEVFIGWDSDDYLYVTGYTLIYAEYRPIGDANTDNVVNLGDAAYILRYSLGLTESEVHNFDKLADYNNDGAINTGDAAGVLAFAVNG